MPAATPAHNAREIQALKAITNKLSRILVGNGEKGMDEELRDLNRRVGVIESDMKEVKRMMQNMVGYAGVQYDQDNHPNRRKSDMENLGDAEKFVDWFKDKVAPGLLQALIMFLAASGFTLLVLHWQDLIK